MFIFFLENIKMFISDIRMDDCNNMTFYFQTLEMSGGFMIHYHMYRNCWPLLALGRYHALTGSKSYGN